MSFQAERRKLGRKRRTEEEWTDFPPLPGFRPISKGGRAAQSDGTGQLPPMGRVGARRACDLLDDTRRFGQVGGLARLAGDVADAMSWQDRNEWLHKLADAAEELAAEARDMASRRPVAFSASGSRIQLTDDAVAPTLTKGDASHIVVWRTPRNPDA